MTIKFREEFVGKRFVCSKVCGKLKNVSEWDWKTGVVRAVSQTHSSPKSKDFQLLVEFDAEEWEKREWVRPNCSSFQVFLVEKTLVWAVKSDVLNDPSSSKAKRRLHPALSFLALIDKVGLKGLGPIEYLDLKQLDFQEEQNLIPHTEERSLNECSEEEASAVRQWVEYQAGQSILLTTPTILAGYRVQVYRAEGTTQWYTAFIQRYNSSDKELCIYDDTVLEEHNENPALIEIRLLGTGVVDSILKGTPVRPASRRCVAAAAAKEKDKDKDSALSASSKPSVVTGGRVLKQETASSPVGTVPSQKGTPAVSQRVSVVRTTGTRRGKGGEKGDKATPLPSPATATPPPIKAGKPAGTCEKLVSQSRKKRELRKRTADQIKCEEQASSPKPSSISTLFPITSQASSSNSSRETLTVPSQVDKSGSTAAEGGAVTVGPTKLTKRVRKQQTKAQELSVNSSLSKKPPTSTKIRKVSTTSEKTVKVSKRRLSPTKTSLPQPSSQTSSPSSKTKKRVTGNSAPSVPIAEGSSIQTVTTTALNISSAVSSSAISEPTDSLTKPQQIIGSTAQVATSPTSLTNPSQPCSEESGHQLPKRSPRFTPPHGVAGSTVPTIRPVSSTSSATLSEKTPPGLSSESVDNGSTSGYSSTADNLSPRHEKMNGITTPHTNSTIPSASKAMNLPPIMVTTPVSSMKKPTAHDHVNGHISVGTVKSEVNQGLLPSAGGGGGLIDIGGPSPSVPKLTKSSSNHTSVSTSRQSSGSSSTSMSVIKSNVSDRHASPLALGQKSAAPVKVYRDPALIKKDEESRKRQTSAPPPPHVRDASSAKSVASGGRSAAGQSPAAGYPPPGLVGAAAALQHPGNVQMQIFLAQQRAAAMAFSPGPVGMMAAAAGGLSYDPAAAAASQLHALQQHQQQQQFAYFYANLASASQMEAIVQQQQQQHKMAAAAVGSLGLPPGAGLGMPHGPGGSGSSPAAAAAAALAAQYMSYPPYQDPQQMMAREAAVAAAAAAAAAASKEREKKREKDRLEKEREKAAVALAAAAARERQEKEERAAKESSATAAVDYHFSQSLRLASEKGKSREKPNSAADRRHAMSGDDRKNEGRGRSSKGSTTSIGVSPHGITGSPNAGSTNEGSVPKHEPKLNIYGYRPESQATTFISQDKLQQHLIKKERDGLGEAAGRLGPHPLPPSLPPSIPHSLPPHSHQKLIPSAVGARMESVIHPPPNSRHLNGGSALPKAKSSRGGGGPRGGSVSASSLVPSSVASLASSSVQGKHHPSTSYHPVTEGLVPNPMYSGSGGGGSALTTSSSISALERMAPMNQLTAAGLPPPTAGRPSGESLVSSLTEWMASSANSTGGSSGSSSGLTLASAAAKRGSETEGNKGVVVHSFRTFVESAVTEAFYKDMQQEKENSESGDVEKSSSTAPAVTPATERPEIPRVVNGLTAMDSDSDTMSAPSPSLSSATESHGSNSQHHLQQQHTAASSSASSNMKKKWIQRHSHQSVTASIGSSSGAPTGVDEKSSGAVNNGNGGDGVSRFDNSSSEHVSSDHDSDREALPSPPKKKRMSGKGSAEGKRTKAVTKKQRSPRDVSSDEPPAAKVPKGRKKPQQVYTLQDGFCTEKAPKLKKCRECKLSQVQRGNKLTNIFCRFYAFRRLKVNAKGTVCTAGFSEPSDATQEDIDLWLPDGAVSTLDVHTAKYIIANVGDEFCKLVVEERECRQWAQPNSQIAWKRAVQGVREMCDVCCTTLFNMHWTCHNCGFAVCLDCYKEKRNEEPTADEVDGSTESGRASASSGSQQQHLRQWLTCSMNKTVHDATKMMLTQIIPSDTLAAVGDLVHAIRRKHYIKSRCLCGVNDGFDKSPPAKKNGVSQQLLAAVNLASVNQRLGVPYPEAMPSVPFPRPSLPTLGADNNRALVPLSTYSNDPLSLLADVASTKDKQQAAPPHSRSNDSSVGSGEGALMMDVDPVPTTNSTVGEVNDRNEETPPGCAAAFLAVSGGRTNGSRSSTATTAPVITSLEDFIQNVVESNLASTPSPPSVQSKYNPSESALPVQYSHYQPRVGSFMQGRDEPVPRCTLSETSLLYPNVPHSWLCEGRLLRLHSSKHSGNFTLFTQRWRLGLPVVVSNVTKEMNTSLWHPSRFSEEFGHISHDLVNCSTGVVQVGHHLANFWDGFESIPDRLLDDKGEPMLMKLKDWPSTEDFSELMPSRFHDLMSALPMPEYTQRRGHLNLAARLPDFFVKPDLGPKMYNAYGMAKYPQYGTTNLHLDVSDAVNVMVYVAKQEELDSHVMDVINVSDVDPEMKKRVTEGKERPGALWHIFDACDADKIRDLLNKVSMERGEDIEPFHDPIHDQDYYLDQELRRRLRAEYGVQSYPIIQCAGDAVFIPAGAPHQVQNLNSCVKVAEDFVSPEHLHHCFKLTQEFRSLSGTHANHEDKLQVKNIIYHAVKDAVAVMRDCPYPE